MRLTWVPTHWKPMLMLFGSALLAAPLARAQDAPPPTPAPVPSESAPATPDPTQTPAAQLLPDAAAPEAVKQTPAASSREHKVASAKALKPKKPAKPVYSGPKEVIMLPPTPMLDVEGKQILDPDGNPMFNKPVMQIRDKKGHPVFDASGKPVFQTATDKGYDPRGKRIVVAKMKREKSEPAEISRGTFTVDGMIAKAELNYAIPNFKFLYFYVPGIGVAVVSDAPFQGATVQKNAFKGKTVTINVEDHILELASDKKIIGKQGQSGPAYVEIDRDFALPSRYPVVGYGTINQSPYMWPGSKRNADIAGIIKPPPTPKNLLPVELLTACGPGEMRKPAARVLPGQKAPEQPCVLITKALRREEAADDAGAGTAKSPEPATPSGTPQVAPTDAPASTAPVSPTSTMDAPSTAPVEAPAQPASTPPPM
jgi:hypothetical protein